MSGTSRSLVGFVLACFVLIITAGAAPPAAFAVAGVGGYRGVSYAAHESGDVFEYSEDIAVRFTAPVDVDSFKAAYQISPRTASSVYPVDYGRTMRITIRKVPGVTYTLSVRSGVRSRDGQTLAADFTFGFSAPPISEVPKPLRKTPNEPYRYGTLGHPFPFSLSGKAADRQIAMLARAGVRFVRIDYCGAQIEQAPGRFDWTVEDDIARRLSNRGIVELPVVDQYCAPTWATRGRGYPSIWDEPAEYAAFGKAVAAHITANFPRFTRIELFNEPNLQGWWTNPNPLYAARDGSATAAYMLAAYAAVKSANPKAVVVGPALADGGRDTDPRKFLAVMYESGCARGKCWDVLSVHNYRWINPTFKIAASYQNRWDIYKSLQDIAAQHGDAGTHVMLTEWGFSTADLPEGFDPAVQARYLALGFNLMLADPSVDGIVYVNLYNPGNDFWGRTALTSADFSTLPAFGVYRAFAADVDP